MKKLVIALLTLSLIFAVPAVGALAANPTADTKAQITFTEGDLLFGKIDAMDIIYESVPLNAAGITTKGSATSYAVEVLDGRTAAGDWSVSVKADGVGFKNGGTTFHGTIGLANGVGATNSQTATGTITLNDQSINTATTANSLVAATTSGYSQGKFTLTWQQNDVTLAVNSTEITKPQVNIPYETTLTWTLAQGTTGV